MSSTLDSEVSELTTDVNALIAAIPGAVQTAVANALAANNVDETTQTAALAQVDANVKTALASLQPPSSSATPPTGS